MTQPATDVREYFKTFEEFCESFFGEQIDADCIGKDLLYHAFWEMLLEADATLDEIREIEHKFWINRDRVDAKDRYDFLVQAMFEDMRQLGRKPKLADGIRYLKQFSQMSPNTKETTSVFERLDHLTEEETANILNGNSPVLPVSYY
jgi:hypothetical protein